MRESRKRAAKRSPGFWPSLSSYVEVLQRPVLAMRRILLVMMKGAAKWWNWWGNSTAWREPLEDRERGGGALRLLSDHNYKW